LFKDIDGATLASTWIDLEMVNPTKNKPQRLKWIEMSWKKNARLSDVLGDP
jgi:hypothetical protein